MPTVSVIIPSYNHEKYIQESIQSVLNQTFQDFEIIITDDGSSDKSVEIISQIKDPRIKFFKHSINKGACVAANNCILQSSGRFIAMQNSDDVWNPEKLEIQMKYFDKHPEIAAVFGKVDWIDENGNFITSKDFPFKDVFNVSNRSRFQWLNHFFYKGNCLCHPSSLVRRECYQKVGMFNPAFANIPDFDLWVRICLNDDIMVLNEKLIRFRRMRDESNASGDTEKSRIRNRFEYKQILNHYLSIEDPDEFLMVFPEAKKYGKVTKDFIPFLLGKLAIETNIDFKVMWGLDIIYAQLQNENMAQVLNSEFNFSYKDFIDLSGKYDPFKVAILYPVAKEKPQHLQRSAMRMFLSATKKYIVEIFGILIRIFKN